MPIQELPDVEKVLPSSVLFSRPDLVLQSAHAITEKLQPVLGGKPLLRTRLTVTVRNRGKAQAAACSLLPIFVTGSAVQRLEPMAVPAIPVGGEGVAEALYAPLSDQGELLFLVDAPTSGHAFGQVSEDLYTLLAPTSGSVELTPRGESNNAFVMPYFPDKEMTVHNPAAV